MRKTAAAFLLTCVFSGAVRAADTLAIGPAPTWVKLILPVDTLKDTDAPVRTVLWDEQVSLEPGRQTRYSSIAFKIQTPQGLASGNISLSWRPETDALTVHKVLIRRGDQVIDVLASGQTFTIVRREQNLENAALDGILTANIQPEGLQVGDILEYDASVTSSDPVLKGHAEEIAGAWNGLPIGHAHLRMQWPATIPMRLRATRPLPVPTPATIDGITTVDLSLDNVEPIVPPKGAPPRYRIGRLVEATDYGSWAELSALMAPLYRKASVLPVQGPLRAEAEGIRALSPDPKIRAEAALALVQDKIRYVALSMGAGGLVPAFAESTWSRRFGDCKGKTALLLSLLHDLGIEADPVLVSTAFGDGLDERLPMISLFDHVLVRAIVGGRTYWMDGTRTGDTSLDRLTVPQYAWGLPVAVSGRALVRMVPVPLEIPAANVSIRIDATAGLTAPAPTRIETIFRGDEAIASKAGFANLAGDARDRTLREYWKRQYDFITVKSTSASFDPKSGEEHLTMEGESKMDWSDGTYQLINTTVGSRADFSRDPGPDRDAPFLVNYPTFTRTQQTILLPKGHGAFGLGAGSEVDQTIAGVQYRRHATSVDDVVSIETTERSVAPEFNAKDAPAAQAALRTLADRSVTLREPLGFESTDTDIAAARADAPTTADGFEKRAVIYLNRGMRAEALQDFSKAVELDPTDIWAWSNRALTRAQMGDLVGSRTDLEKAEALDPGYVAIFLVRGILADAEHRPKDAIDAYSKVIQLEPGNHAVVARRADAYAAIGDSKRAFADRTTAAAAAIAENPDAASPYSYRGSLMLDMKRYDDAISDFTRALAIEPGNATALAGRGFARVWEDDFKGATQDLDAASAIDPKNFVALQARGELAQKKGAWRDAIADFTAALQIQPRTGFALGHRAEAERAIHDDDDVLRDSAAAIEQEPRWVELYLLRANVFFGQGKKDQALSEAVAVTAAAPDDSFAAVVAANIYSALHKDFEAMQAYDRAIAIKPEPFVYLNRSVHRPKADVSGRLADLDAALKLDPNFVEASFGKGEMQANMGDFAGAVATYSNALKNAPGDALLLTARGIVYARSGDQVLATEDFVQARSKSTTASIFNHMCWAKAIAGVALESALTDCNVALAKEPDAANYLDSRGLVLLRLGRLDDAIADYTLALSKDPAIASSLFGRAIALARKGSAEKSKTDASAALKIDPKISDRFDEYGVKLQ